MDSQEFSEASSSQVKQSDFYQILEISREADLDEIKKQYRKLSLLYHPDKKTGDEMKYSQINLAYKILSNEKKRKKYDNALAGTIDELRKVERDLGYHRNEDFITVNPETGKEEFDIKKFSQNFQQQNVVLDQDFQAPQGSVDDLIKQRHAERDQLLAELNQQTQSLASNIRDLGDGNADQFNNSFNQIFEDLKRRNKELVESNQSTEPGFDGGQFQSGWDMGMGASNWDNQPQTGIMTAGEQINLNAPGFQSDEVMTSIQSASMLSNQDNKVPEWRQKTPAELLEARMNEYKAETELLEKYRDQDFQVNLNPEFLSCLEVEETAEETPELAEETPELAEETPELAEETPELAEEAPEPKMIPKVV